MNDATSIANSLARYFAAVDSREWDRVELLMTNPFHVDYSSFGGGDPAHREPSAILADWKAFLPGFDHTHHQIGNLDLSIDDDRAEAICYVTATHVIGDRVWTVVGSYHMTLVLRGSLWKLSGSRFLFKYQAGDTGLPAEAQERAAASP